MSSVWHLIKTGLDDRVDDMINIKAQTVTTLSEEDFSMKGAEHPPEHENEGTIAGKCKSTEVE